MEDATNAPATTPAHRPYRYALGIDVSKRKLDLALLDPSGNEHATTVSNAPDGFEALRDWLSDRLAGDTTGLEQVHACLEASGGYQEKAARFLVQQGLPVSVVNPRRLSAYAQSQLRRSKTDSARPTRQDRLGRRRAAGSLLPAGRPLPV